MKPDLLHRFLLRNGHVDLLHFDFHDPRQRATLQGTASELEEEIAAAKVSQRLRRLHARESTGEALAKAGLTSAHDIAAMPADEFVRVASAVVDEHPDDLRQLHGNAVQVTRRVAHLAANVRDLVASPYWRATSFANTDPLLIEYFESIPSYPELFGTLDFCRCAECRSIFSPAAYLLDLLRITQKYITDRSDIQPEYLLKNRRPDIFSRKLDCANTNQLVPFLQIANEVIEAKLHRDGIADVWGRLAAARYPMNLPFVLPLDVMRLALAKVELTLADVWGSVVDPVPGALGTADMRVALASLDVSPDLAALVTTPDSSPAALAAAWGLDVASHLPFDGPGRVWIEKGSKSVRGAGTDFLALHQQEQIRTAEQTRTIETIDAAEKLSVDAGFSTTAGDLPYTIIPVGSLSLVPVFSYRTALSVDELDELFIQGLSAKELQDGIANAFFINSTGDALPYLHIDTNIVDSSNPIAEVVGVESSLRLDRVHRFIRLSRRSGIPFAALDTLMRAAGATEITDAFLLTLANVKALVAAAGLSWTEAAAFMANIETIRKGDGTTPADLFDIVFNAPGTLGGRDPYTARTPIPFDPARPLTWHVGETAAAPVTSGVAAGGSATTITLAASASSADNAYDGLAVSIVNGAGKGQVGVVKAYAGSARVATMYDAWTIAPDATSEYAVANAPALTDRLSAALKINQTDLTAVGTFLVSALGYAAPLIPLTLTNLTFLYRLTVLPLKLRWKIDAFFWLFRLTTYPSQPVFAPPAGILTPGTGTPADLLALALRLVDAMNAVTASPMSVYEIGYVVTGVAGSQLRIGVDPNTLPRFLKSLAQTSSNALITPTSLVVGDLDANGADRVLAQLVAKSFVTRGGVVLRNQAAWNAAAALPANVVTPTRFVVAGTITPAEARYAFDTLQTYSPPILVAKSSTEATLSDTWTDIQQLAALFPIDANAEVKRLAIASALDAVRTGIRAAEYAPVVTVDASDFVTDLIDARAASVVYGALSSHGVLVDAGDARGSVAPTFTGATPLDYLFVSAGSGQARTLAAYDGATRTATVSAAWTTVPDAFSIYEISSPLAAGIAQGGASDSITLAADSSTDDGAYSLARVSITAGTGAGQTRTIVRYAGATRIATVDAPWTSTPDATSVYAVALLLTRGTVTSASGTTVVLAPDASNETDAYTNATLAIVDDPARTEKTAEVRTLLLATQRTVDAVAEVVERTRADQVQNVINALADYLRFDSGLVAPLLPFSAADSELGALLVDFLSPPPDTVPASVATIVTGLVRSGLLADKLSLDATVLRAVARAPAPYGVVQPSTLTFADVIRLARLRAFMRDVGDVGGATPLYFAAAFGAACPDSKIAFLSSITTWPAEQICAMVALMWPGDATRRPATLSELLRVAAGFEIVGRLGATPEYLAATLAVGNLRTGSAEAWRTYTNAADATLAVVTARLTSPDADETRRQLDSSIEEAKRDALVGFTIFTLQATLPIVTPSDLFQFLLIDVEMSGCDSTSYIAQAIGSVQLYMQRVRMRLEPGANADSIDRIWWDWLSNYRVWEVNRKVFLYPENYVDPSLRRDASPAFAKLSDALTRGVIDETSVVKAYTAYFQEFSTVAELVHVGAYSSRRLERDGETRTDTLFLVGRTNTEPYRFFTRTVERSSVCSSETWRPWQEIDETIKSDYATPVYAFDRLFIFWIHVEPRKSSVVDERNSISQSVTRTTLYYTFQTVTGEWVAAQRVAELSPAWVAENTNPNVKEEPIATAFLEAQHWWRQPYIQAIDRGIPAAGTLSFTAGSSQAEGTGTQFARQLAIGDRLWAAGEEQLVTAVDAGKQTLTIASKWSQSGELVPFKISPKDPTTTTFPAFAGTGSILITADFNVVAGFGTDFLVEVTVGDRIAATAPNASGDLVTETRAVVLVQSADTLVVGEDWTIGTTFVDHPGRVSVFEEIFYVDGVGTRFLSQFKPKDFIRVGQQVRQIAVVTNDTKMQVTRAWDTEVIDAEYVGWAPMLFTVIPRTSGEERLVIVEGPGLPLRPLPKPEGKIEANPGEDPFIDSLNAFNRNLNDVIAVAAKAKALNGRIAALPATVVNASLESQATRLLAADFSPGAIATTPPVRAVLSRENALLTLAIGVNPLFDMYWSNSAPGTVGETATGPVRPLLYNVDARRALSLNVGNQLGAVLFNNGRDAYLLRLQDPRRVSPSSGAMLRPFSAPFDVTQAVIAFGPFSTAHISFGQMRFGVTRLTTSVAGTLQRRLLAGGTDGLLRLENQQLEELPFNAFYAVPSGPPPATLDPSDLPSARMDWHGAYAVYFREIFFHAALLIADRLKSDGNFADAKRWYEHIFDPTAPPDLVDRHPNDRYWRYLPFRTMDLPTLTQILTNTCEIDAYHNDPFDPDAIASLRISAYAKATVMKYIDNLIAWGDSLFAQDTRESVGQAAQLYVLAQDLLGARPLSTGDCFTPAPLSFDELSARFPNGIPEFLIDLENSAPLDSCPGCRQFAQVPFNALPVYFCVPENADLIALWDRVDDRLFKIRNCMNLQGVVRHLALFAPPIDPRAFIQSYGATGAGAAAGVSMPPSIPGFRFSFLLDQAQSIAAMVTGFSSSMLAALERQDADTLTVLQNTQETTLLNMMTAIKEQQILQLDSDRAALANALDAATYRKAFYQGLVDGGLSSAEIAQLTLLGLSATAHGASTLLQVVATIAYLAPQVGSPFAMVYGGQQIGMSAATAAAAAASGATVLQLAGEASGIVAGFQRRSQEWGLQKALAEFDEKQFQNQIASIDVQKKIAERDLQVHLQSITQLEALGRFYRTRFTNGQLYSWIAGRMATTFFQAYQVALELARMAQASLEFELGRADRIPIGAWDTSRKGLTAGETLQLALAQLGKSYVQAGGPRRLEIERTISLRHLDPLAYLQLVRTGSCAFDLPEQLFDADYPGHFKRRIHSVAVTLPAVVGPYQNVRATLTQTSSYIVVDKNLDTVKFLLGDGVETPPPGTLLSNVRPHQQIALSTGTADTGLFADADPARYLPFEGTGAVSSWRLSMPQSSNPFALANVSDVVLEVRYSAEDGGAKFAKDVANLDPVRQRHWPVLLMLAQTNPTEWFAFLHEPPSGARQRLRVTMPGLTVPGITDTAVAGVYLGLRVAPGHSAASPRPYVSIEAVPGQPIPLALATTGDALQVFPTPIAIGDLAAPPVISFNLAHGFTPDSLRTADKTALNPDALLDIHLVWFLTGRATS